MLKHYVLVAVRNLIRNKFVSLINILGLAVGMGVCLVICQYIHFDLSYDRFHANAANIYRVTQTTFRHGDEDGTGVFMGYGLGVRSKENIPEVDHFVRIHPHFDVGAVVSYPENNEPFKEEALLFVDSNFLEVFDFPLILGSRTSVLDEKYSIVITDQMAVKYFGTSDPIGKTLNVSSNWTKGDFTVTGVLGRIPVNSHLQFDFLLPLAVLLEKQYRQDNGWGWWNFMTYITVDQRADLDTMREKFDNLIITYDGDNLARSSTQVKVSFQPLKDIHLRSDFDEDHVSNYGSIQDVHIFSVIAIFILIIAWVNYINLSTARSMHRAKEVGIRKSIGAFREQLISQFIVGSVLINFIAACISIGIASLGLPIINNITGRELELALLGTIGFWGGFSALIIFGSILSGLYPAFVLSSFGPVSMLHSYKTSQRGGFNLRRGLIVFQFLVSVLLIAGLYLVFSQITFMKNQELGIDMERILIVYGPSVDIDDANLKSRLQTFKNDVTAHHSIAAVAGSGTVPAKGYYAQREIRQIGAPENTYKLGFINPVDIDFAETYDLRFLAGRAFAKGMPTLKPAAFINEEAVRVFGLGSPREAIHKKLVYEGDTLQVVGVIQNYHWLSLKEAQRPQLFQLSRICRSYFSIKMDLSNIQESITHIESSFSAIFPKDPFNYFFLEGEFNRQYQSDLRFGNLFAAFTILAIFIACLGLFALVSYSASLRVKEIGIRKVLGASISNLMMLLSREYLILLSIAYVLAIPAILYWGGAWLDNYAFRTDLSIELFLIPGLIITFISLLTVSYRTYSTAKANPVDSLRTE